MKKLRIFFALAFFMAAFGFFSCSEIFQGKVSMPETPMQSAPSLFDLLGSEQVEDKLECPVEINASRYEHSSQITISWSKVKNANYYCLERAVLTQKNAQGQFEIPSDLASEEGKKFLENLEFDTLEHSSALYATSYTDKIITETSSDPLDYTNPKYGYAYFYRVCAENPRGGFEASEYKYTFIPAMLLSPPKSVEATLGESSDYVQISWKGAEGANSYEVWRSQNSDASNAVKVGTCNAAVFRFKDHAASQFPGQDLYYKVFAISSGGQKSVESSIALGYTLLPGAPSRVSGVSVKSGKGDVLAADGITISWTSLQGDDDIFYNVYRSSSSDASLVKLTSQGITANEYTDKKKLSQNTYYYYFVQACKIEDDVMKKGQMSDSGAQSATPAEGFILSAPPAFSVSKIHGDSANCILKFMPPVGAQGFSGDSGHHSYNSYEYVVLGDNAQNGTFSQAASFSASLNVKEDGYIEVKVPSYGYYKMYTKFSGKESEKTQVVAPAPYAAEAVYVTRAELVGDISEYKIPGTGSSDMKKETGANQFGVHPVKITWKEPEGGAAGGYHVYRSAKKDSGFRKITENPVKGTSYVDAYEAAKAGVIYYYKVLSLNLLEQGANYSEIDTPTLIDVPANSAEYAGKAKMIDKSKGRGFGWGALGLYQYLQEQRKTIVSSQAKLTLMHKSNNLDKVGKETIYGDISGKLYYDSSVDMGSLSGVVTMPYTDYADAYVLNDESLGVYFFFNGNTNTKANISANGSMNGIVVCQGMYPGKVRYDKVGISGGNAASGTYGVIREGIETDYQEIYWLAAN